MKILLGLFSAFLLVNASASTFNANNDYKNKADSGASTETLFAPNNQLPDLQIYKGRNGQNSLTGISSDNDFSKFTTKEYKDYKKEQYWKSQLAEKPAASIGMSKKQILNSTNWGKPKDTSTTIDVSGTLEQWIYSSTHSLYFKNGKLVKIEK